jgi:GNAT superfamily N-acetyltransferase
MVVTLADGSGVSIRSIRPSDKAELQAGLGRLSERSRYMRFLTPKERFSAAELRYLTEVDGVGHYAIVATPLDDPGRIVAVGRWVRLSEQPDTAEAAIVVADGLQRNGLGRELSRRLADAAARRGIRRFTATIHGTNVAASKLLAAMHLHLERHTSAGVTEVSWDLAA